MKPSLRGTPALAALSSSCTISTRSTPGSRNAASTSAADAAVARPQRDGPSLAELAAQRGVDPLDVLCDVALDDDLATRFRVVVANDDAASLAGLLRDDRTLLGLSDAGAHASQLCDAVFSTYLLEHWVRETGTLSLEKAIWRITGHPAAVFGIPGRGRVAPGYFADLVAFDPAAVGVERMERVYDLPAGADRLIARSHGLHQVWVNGELASDGDGDGRPAGGPPHPRRRNVRGPAGPAH